MKKSAFLIGILLLTGCAEQLNLGQAQIDWRQGSDAICQEKYQTVPGTPAYDLCHEIQMQKRKNRLHDKIYWWAIEPRMSKKCDEDLGEKCLEGIAKVPTYPLVVVPYPSSTPGDFGGFAGK